MELLHLVVAARRMTESASLVPLRFPDDADYAKYLPTDAEAEAIASQSATDAVLLLSKRAGLLRRIGGGDYFFRRAIAGVCGVAARDGLVRDAQVADQIIRAAAPDRYLLKDAADAVSMARLATNEFEEFLSTALVVPAAQPEALRILGLFRPDLLKLFHERAHRLGHVDPLALPTSETITAGETS